MNNAGVSTFGEVEFTSMDTYKQVSEINLWGTIRVTKAVLPLIRKAKGQQLKNNTAYFMLILDEEVKKCPKWLCHTPTTYRDMHLGFLLMSSFFWIRVRVPIKRKEWGQPVSCVSWFLWGMLTMQTGFKSKDNFFFSIMRNICKHFFSTVAKCLQETQKALKWWKFAWKVKQNQKG